jgi:hypothetical protein
MKLIERIYKDGLIQEMADCVRITEYGQYGGSSIHGGKFLSEHVHTNSTNKTIDSNVMN